MGIQLFDEASVYNQATRFANATGTAITGITDTVQQARRINAVNVTNNDTIAHVMSLYMNVGGTSYLLGSVSVPAGTGTLGTPGVNILPSCLPATIDGITLQSGTSLQLAMAVAVVATFAVDVLALGGVI